MKAPVAMGFVLTSLATTFVSAQTSIADRDVCSTETSRDALRSAAAAVSPISSARDLLVHRFGKPKAEIALPKGGLELIFSRKDADSAGTKVEKIVLLTLDSKGSLDFECE